MGKKMTDKELIKSLLNVIRGRDAKILELLRRLPFDDLSIKEQEIMVLDGIF